MTLAKMAISYHPCKLGLLILINSQSSRLKKHLEGLRPFEEALLILKVGPLMIWGLLETNFQLVSQTVKR